MVACVGFIEPAGWVIFLFGQRGLKARAGDILAADVAGGAEGLLLVAGGAVCLLRFGGHAVQEQEVRRVDRARDGVLLLVAARTCGLGVAAHA